MTSISSIYNTANSSTTSSSSTANALGKEDFLTLLVAQMKNQDPLDPDDPTEFTAQLAQFSSLEQLFNLNDALEDISSAFESSSQLLALGILGREVAFASDTVYHDGETSILGYQLADDAAEVTITLQQDGATVAVLDSVGLTEGTHYVSWDGATTKGTSAEAGTYMIVVEALDAQGNSVTAESLVRDLVTGTNLDNDNGSALITDSGTVSFSAIVGVLDPGTSTEVTADNS